MSHSYPTSTLRSLLSAKCPLSARGRQQLVSSIRRPGEHNQRSKKLSCVPFWVCPLRSSVFSRSRLTAAGRPLVKLFIRFDRCSGLRNHPGGTRRREAWCGGWRGSFRAEAASNCADGSCLAWSVVEARATMGSLCRLGRGVSSIARWHCSKVLKAQFIRAPGRRPNFNGQQTQKRNYLRQRGQVPRF
jgi:hypothetical protein